MNSSHQGDTPVVKSPDEARAGVTGHGVRYVLDFALAGALVAFVLLSLYFGPGGH
jgi:hypothetical protein